MTPLERVTAATKEVDRAIEAVEALYQTLREMQRLLVGAAEQLAQAPATAKPPAKR